VGDENSARMLAGALVGGDVGSKACGACVHGWSRGLTSYVRMADSLAVASGAGLMKTRHAMRFEPAGGVNTEGLRHDTVAKAFFANGCALG
jgi:hypothetical protein